MTPSDPAPAPLTPAEEKQQTLTEYLRRGVTAIAADTRQQGVDVPDDRRSPTLILNLSHRYRFPIEISAWGVRSVLSFAGVNCPVAIPWGALIAMRTDADGGHVAAWPAPPEPLPFEKRRGILGLVALAPPLSGPEAA